MYPYHQLLSNHCGFKFNAIMKCGTYSTVVIMQAVYCLIGIVSLSTKYKWLVNLLAEPRPPIHFLQFRKNCDLQCVHCGFLVLRTEACGPGIGRTEGGGGGVAPPPLPPPKSAPALVL